MKTARPSYDGVMPLASLVLLLGSGGLHWYATHNGQTGESGLAAMLLSLYVAAWLAMLALTGIAAWAFVWAERTLRQSRTKVDPASASNHAVLKLLFQQKAV